LYFNRAIDINLLSIRVRETLHGQTYINNDPLGVDFIDATGFTLTEVNRDLVSVSGRLELIPGSAAIAFYPERNVGFNKLKDIHTATHPVKMASQEES
jgi:hypothetical protein